MNESLRHSIQNEIQTYVPDDESAVRRHGMTRSVIRILVAIALGTLIISAAVPLHFIEKDSGVMAAVHNPRFLVVDLLLGVAVLFATAGIYLLLKKLNAFLDGDAQLEAQFLDALNPKFLDVSIALSAALGLFLELALIRWQSSVLEFLAFYKNFSLLACFAGLGLGYALANRSRIPLILVIPLLTWQFVFMMITRAVPGFFQVIPFREQLNMGPGSGGWVKSGVLYVLLTIIFLLTALTFLPLGQLCGRLMEHRTKLRAYSLNLLGSLVGVALMLLASFLWTPPLVWFALCFLALLAFHVRRPRSLLVGIASALIATIALAWWPVAPLWNRVYSPYQVLEIGVSPDTGMPLIMAAGHYYQRIHNFSTPSLSDNERHVRDYYDFPYKLHPQVNDVAVVGAGTGNDVAAALRAGAGTVDAIEIDPAIMKAGKLDHPEQPYTNPRTHAIVNDARSFLRTTDRKYDLIVYGLLDSHTLLSHGSAVRLDSFVYTVEGLREARNRLKPDGVISLSFALLSESLGRKIYLMLQEAFDGRPPLCVQARYDNAEIFIASNDPNAKFARSVAVDSGFDDQTAFYGNPALHASLSTDDWPFFYMPLRVYPTSYLIMISQILILSLILSRNFLGEAPRFSHASFFFLGAGFMLIETKGITEMGLTFGNTWQVVGIVIAGILTMAFVGNGLVSVLDIKRPFIPYVLLWISILAGWFVAKSGGFASTPFGRLETVLILTCPLLFSGIVFSSLLTSKGQVSGMMATNLFGAICGGLLEYNSMYFGFRWLYLAALACYVLAFASDLIFARRKNEATSGPQAQQVTHFVSER